MGWYYVCYVADVAVSEFVFFCLESQGVALNADNPTEAEVFIAELLGRVEEVFPFFCKKMNFLSDCEVVLEVLDGRQILQWCGSYSIEDVDFNQFAFEFDIDGVDAVLPNAENNSNWGAFAWRRILHSFLLIFPQIGRGNGQPKIAFLAAGDIDFHSLADVGLIDLDAIDLQFPLRYDSLDVIAELDNCSIGVDIADETAIFFVLVDGLLAEE